MRYSSLKNESAPIVCKSERRSLTKELIAVAVAAVAAVTAAVYQWQSNQWRLQRVPTYKRLITNHAVKSVD